MGKWTSCLLGLLLGYALAGGFPPGDPPQGQTVPCREPSFFFAPAEAAFWSHWLQEPAQALDFSEMYAGASSLGLTFSDKISQLVGKRVTMVGFMAPPLKPTLAFFVLTQVPMSICPFCSTDADWPNNIVVVKLKEPVTALPFDQPIRVSGTLEIGSQLDEETGFVSLVRIQADQVEQAE